MPTFDVTDDEGYARLRRYLRRRRQRLHISQDAMAATMGTTQDVISKFERGLTDPRISTIGRYIRALGAVPEWGVRLAVPHPDCQLKNEIHGPHPVRELKDRSIVCYGVADPEVS